MTKKRQPAITPLRLPPDLREWIKAEADKNRRSVNSEVILLIEAARDQAQQTKEGNAS